MNFRKMTVIVSAFVAAGATAAAQDSEFEMPMMRQNVSAQAETEILQDEEFEMPMMAQEIQTDVLAEAEQTEAAVSDDTADVSDMLANDWESFQIQVGDQVYQFPMMYEDFVSYGWESDDLEGEELDPYQYSFFTFERGEVSCYVYMVNLGINTLPAKECIVAGMSVDRFGWPLDASADSVILPGGIVRGKADREAIESCYGTPVDVYEGDLYQQLTYELDYNRDLVLYVYKESGVLEDIEIENFVEPEGYEIGEASEEIPAAVSSYNKPEVLSDDMTAYEIEVAGNVYALPVPVSVLVADGWEINREESDAVIAAGYYGWVALRKDNQEFRQIVVNNEKYATIPENCWIEEIEVGGYTLEMDGALPGGVRIGITEEDLLALFEANDIVYEADDSSEMFTYYTYNQLEYDQECEVMIYKDTDEQFPQNTVMSIVCSNAFQ